MVVDVDAAPDDHELVVSARIVFLPVGDRGFGLERGLVVDLGLEPRLDHRGRLAQGRFRVALDLRLVETEVRDFGVELNGRGIHGRFRAAQGRQGFQRDLAPSASAPLRVLPGVGRHRQDRIPDVADLVLAEQRAVRYEVLQDVRAADVRRGQHPRYAGHLLCFGGVDRDDARVRKMAAQDRKLQRPGNAVVGREVRGAAGLGHGGWARVGYPHDALGRIRPNRLGRSFAAQETSRQLHRLDDLLVAGAAAQVPPQGVFDLLDRWLRVLVQQRLGRHDHPGRAKPALDGPGQDKRLLDEVRVVGGPESFDRDDVRAFQVAHLGQTRSHGLAVDHHHAGAALALAVAGLLGTGQAQILAQQLQQRRFRIDNHLT